MRPLHNKHLHSFIVQRSHNPEFQIRLPVRVRMQTGFLRVANFGNGPAAACNLRFGEANLDSQSKILGIKISALKNKIDFKPLFRYSKVSVPVL